MVLWLFFLSGGSVYHIMDMARNLHGFESVNTGNLFI